MQVMASTRAGLSATFAKLVLIVALVLAPLAMSHGTIPVTNQSDIAHSDTGHLDEASNGHGEQGNHSRLSFMNCNPLATGSSTPSGDASHSHDQCCSSFCGSAIVALQGLENSYVPQGTHADKLVAAILPGELVNPGRPPRI